VGGAFFFGFFFSRRCASLFPMRGSLPQIRWESHAFSGGCGAGVLKFGLGIGGAL
jgi:hypothetical protein